MEVLKMIEQMEQHMTEQRLADAAELERQIRETEDRLIDLRMRQAALLAGNIQPMQTVADESLENSPYDQRDPNADLYDPIEAFLDADDQAAEADFRNKPDVYETT
jgi:hypothetical protein